jgi:hypothetical protein
MAEKWTRNDRGRIGELFLHQRLDDEGMHVFIDWEKHVNERGIDLVAYDAKTRKLWLIDNKAWKSGIGTASSLTKNYEPNVKEVQAYLETQTEKEGLAALKALREGRVVKVLANGFALDTSRFTKGAFEKGFSVYDVRLGRLFDSGSHAAWEAAYKGLSARSGARIVGKGYADVGSLLIVTAVIGGAFVIARSDAEVQQVAGEIVVSLGTDLLVTALTKSGAAGGLASWFITMENDRSAEENERIKREQAIYDAIEDKLDYMHLPREEQEEIAKVVTQLAREPMEPPAEPAAPATRPARPLWQKFISPWSVFMSKNETAPSHRNATTTTNPAAPPAVNDAAQRLEEARQRMALTTARMEALSGFTSQSLEHTRQAMELSRQATETTKNLQHVTNQIAQQINHPELNVSMNHTRELLNQLTYHNQEMNNRMGEMERNLNQANRVFKPEWLPQVPNFGEREWHQWDTPNT